MRNPMFSIIVSSYNVEDYLGKCIESFINQTMDDYEIIIVNDGSTDCTGTIAQKYATQYECVRCINKENGGLSSARNAGIEVAKGAYIHMCDADDWVSADFLEKIRDQICKFEKNYTRFPDVLKFNHYRYCEDKATFVGFSAKQGDYLGKEQIGILLDKAFESAGNYGLSSCMHVYRKEFITNNRITFVSEKEVGSEDYLFNLEVMLKAESIIVLKEAFYYYYLRSGSLTQRYRNRLPEQYVCLYNRFLNILSGNQLYKGYLNKFQHMFVWNLMYGSCFVNEYNAVNGHTMKSGRKKIKKICSIAEMRKAVLSCLKVEKNTKKIVLLYCMFLKFEPIFYWLFVLKPKKGKNKK